MSKSRGRMSKALTDACTKNTHHHLALQKQLDHLDRQRTRQSKDMQKDVRKIQQGAKDTSPSLSDPPAVVRTRTGSASPRRGVSSPQRRSSSPRQAPPTNQRTGCSRFRSGSASSVTAAGKRHTLAPSALLPRRRYRSVNGARSVSGPRRSSVAGAVDVTVSDLKVQIVQPSNPAHQQRQPRSQLSVPPDPHPSPVNLPEIVVSNDTAEDPLRLPLPKTQGPPQKKKPRSRSSSSSPGSDSGSEHLPPPPNSPTSGLPVPRAERPRRHSMPMITSPAAGRPASRRPPSPPTPPDPEPSDSLQVRSSSPRDRSSSFSGIVPARRRGSIPERWGSLAERSKPTSSSRRSSMDMDRLVRDLRYGVLNRELMRAARSGSSSTSLFSSPPTSSSLWEQLKDCRYLRVPSGYSSEEEISNID